MPNRDVALWGYAAAKLAPPLRAYLLRVVNVDEPPNFVSFMETALAAGGRGANQGVAKMLIDRGVLVRILCNPDLLDLEQAIDVMRLALTVDPHFELLLLRHQADPSESAADEMTSAEMVRVLDLLQGCGGIKRHMLILMRRFLRAADAQVRSRAVRLVSASYPAYIEAAISDPDPRVRSNLLEAVCEGEGKPAPYLLSLLRRSSTDSNHRVATTALYYLAVHGERTALPRLKEMLKHPSPAHRRAAAWALVKLNQVEYSGNSSDEPAPQQELAAAAGPSGLAVPAHDSP